MFNSKNRRIEKSKNNFILASAMILAFAGAARSAEIYVSTAGSDETGAGTIESPYRTIHRAVSAAAGGDEIRVAGGEYNESVTNAVERLTFTGSWDDDFTARDLRNNRSVVKPANAALPCFLTTVVSNRIDGFTLTGGSIGFYASHVRNFASSPNSKKYQRNDLVSCIVTNNVGDGLKTHGYAIACVSSLVAFNGGNGVLYDADNAGFIYLVNSTVISNGAYGVRSAGNDYFVGYAYNSILADNRSGNFLKRLTNGETLYLYASVLHAREGTYNYSFPGAVNVGEGDLMAYMRQYSVVEDPLLGEGFAPLEGSPANKRGRDWSASLPVGCEADLWGEPWNGEYDAGCVKSPHYPVARTETDLTVAPDGDCATITEALKRIADGGTIRIADGRYDERLFITVPDVKLIGESRDGVVINAGTDIGNIVEMADTVTLLTNGTVLVNLTLTGGVTGLRTLAHTLSGRYAVTNCLVSGNAVGVRVPQSTVSLARADYPVFSRCSFVDNRFYGFFNGDACHVDNSLFADNGVCGIYRFGWDTSPRMYVYSSTIAGNGECGIYMRQSYVGGLSVWNSVIAVNPVGVTPPSYNTKPSFKNCLFDNETDLSSTYATVIDALYGDALLNDSIANRYAPLPGSPAATNAASAEESGFWNGVDLNGDARNPAADDIGCYRSFETADALKGEGEVVLLVTGEDAEYGTPEPDYGSRIVAGESLDVDASGTLVTDPSDGTRVFYVSDTQRAVYLGFSVTDENGAAVTNTAESGVVGLSGSSTLTWLWKTQLRLVTDCGVLGTKAKVNGGEAFACQTNWIDAGTVVTIELVPDLMAESFIAWLDAPEGVDVSSETITFTLDKTYSLGISSRPLYYVCGETGDDANDGSIVAPWKTINRAFSSGVLEWGDEVRVRGGEYVESVTNKTVSGVRLMGGYDENWSRDLKSHRSVVVSPSTKLDCMYFHSVASNTVSGFTLTGGNRGFYYTGMYNGVRQPSGSRYHVYMQLSQLVVSNNVSYGVSAYNTHGLMLSNSLIAGNRGAAVNFNSDNMGYHYVYNCTVADNYSAYETVYDGSALLFKYGYSACIIRNCIFSNPKCKYEIQSNEGGNSMYISYTALDRKNALTIDGGSSTGQVRYRAGMRYLDPMLEADYSLSAGSPLLKSGENLEKLDKNGPSNYLLREDINGEPWGGVYDYGCFKSPDALTAPARHADVYVSPDGDDSNDGLSPETPLFNPSLAMQKVAEGGTVHLAAGVYTNSVFVDGRHVTVKGAGPGRTVLLGKLSEDYRPQLVLAGEECVVRDLTSTGGRTGVYIPGTFFATSCLVYNCSLESNVYGVFSRGSASATGGLRDEYTSAWPYNRISHCSITDNTTFGVMAHNAYQNFVGDNLLVARNGVVGICDYAVKGVNCYYYHCTIADNGEYGVSTRRGYKIVANTDANDGTTINCKNCIVTGHTIAGAQRNVYVGFTFVNGVASGNVADFTAAGGTIAASSTSGVSRAAMQYVRRRGYDHFPALGSAARGAAKPLTATDKVQVTDDLLFTKRSEKHCDAGCFAVPDPGFIMIVR